MTGYAEIARAYRDAAPTLRAQWRDVDMERWRAPMAAWLTGKRILDVGAGTGELASYLAERAFVTAVGSTAALWDSALPRLDDRLPRLARVRGRFDLVLCLSVFHHLTPRDQVRAFQRLAALTAPGGRLILALRHGRAGTRTWPVRAAHLRAPGFHRRRLHRRGALQPASAARGVRFTWVIFENRAR
ncbi:MAG: class I SAM-dependent methyltransferase [Pseudomonadota bacterium]